MDVVSVVFIYAGVGDVTLDLAATSADRQYGVILECVAGVTDDAVVSCVRVDGDAAVADGLGDPAPVVLDS